MISPSRRIDSSYSCPVCCPDAGPFYTVDGVEVLAGSFIYSGVNEEWSDCYGRPVIWNGWIPGLYTVAPTTAESNMMAYGSMKTDGYVAGNAIWHTADYPFVYYNNDGMDCYTVWDTTYSEGPIEVVNVTITKPDGSALPQQFRLGITGTVISGGAISRKQSLKATVTPATAAANVTIDVSSKITLSNVQRNGGTITFDVVGNSASTNAGDSVILAKLGAAISTSVPVSVVVPSKIATPHDTTGTYQAVNRVLNASTSPAILGLAAGKVSLQTIYVRNLTITVKDQFNGLIGDIYAGAEVTETFGTTNFSINQPLLSSSTYTDPVGLGIEDSVVDATSAATNWSSQPLQPMVNASATQNIPVRVDGFLLVPAISARTWTTTFPNTLTISWPN